MKKITYILLVVSYILIFKYNANAQSIINSYAAVLDYQPCNNVLVVDSSGDFSVGDTVLMIQMKGAIIDTSNTASFGTILSYNGCGNYEYNVIKSINGNNIGLKYTIVRNYDIPYGKVQIVKVPGFQNYTVSQPQTCLPWDGTKGGVYAIYVSHILTLNNDINVSEKGFKGGTSNQNPTQIGPIICSNPNYYMLPEYDSGSMKGEGISEVTLGKSYGKGRLANGGGGGNAHNAGGGGGGNANFGGIGGNEYYECYNISPNNPAGGVAGSQLLYSNTDNKIFLGGGGGSAQVNNFTISNGGHGGGICIITADTIIGNDRSIYANGGDGSQCINDGTFGSCHDGMAGGGGAGVILLNVNTFTGNLNNEAKGGRGADETADAGYGEVGPGGGGGGGILWVKPSVIPATITNNFSGGANGIIVFNNSNWGAEPGLSGNALTNLILDFPIDSFINNEVEADFLFNRTNCFTFNFVDQSNALSGTITSWSWDFSDNSGSSLQSPVHTFPGYGTYEVTLIVTNNNGCSESITKEINIPYIPFAFAGNDTGICANKSVILNASGGVSYSWLPLMGLDNANIAMPVASPSQATTYIVTVINGYGCTDKDSINVKVFPAPDVMITADRNMVSCDMCSLQLNATGGIQYNWLPGEYCSDSTVANPIVMPASTTTFTVKGTDIHGCEAIDTMTIYVYGGSETIFMPNAFSPNGDGRNEKIMPMILCNFNLEQYAIFNRYGERVFSTSKVNEGWDGMYKNKVTDVGTYYYFIKGKNSMGESITYKGDISLVR